MKRLCFCLLLFTSYLGASATPVLSPVPVHEAYISKFSYPTIPTPIGVRPPASNNEEVPSRPYDDAIWIPGYYAYVAEEGDFVWVCGVWRRPPPEHVWIEGEWMKRNGGWIWVRGFWSPVALDKLTYIKEAPPKSIDDDVPVSPGKNYFWVPGCWESSGKIYSWLKGKWQVFNENWVLAPACYVWRPTGYVFVPIYWDLPLNNRGAAYTCEGRGIILEPDLAIRQILLYYSDYLTFYWHWCYYHPDFWGDCWCLPPWWSWSEWWTFCECDLWGLWWWWGHPGFFPPVWLTLQLSLEIAPPPEEMLALFSKMSKPDFPTNKGKKPLLPKGIPGTKELSKPHIPNDVTPGGVVNVPETPSQQPGRQIAPPPPPSAPSQPSYQPPTYPQYEESQRYYPTPKPRKPPRYRPKKPPSRYEPPQSDYVLPSSYQPPQTDYVPPSSYQPPSNYQPEITPSQPQRRPSKKSNRGQSTFY